MTTWRGILQSAAGSIVVGSEVAPASMAFQTVRIACTSLDGTSWEGSFVQHSRFCHSQDRIRTGSRTRR